MRRTLALRTANLIAALLILATTAFAQSGPTQSQPVASLVEGPERGRGIEQFAPDLTPFWRGLYSLPGGSVTIHYTEDSFPQTENWLPTPCSTRSLVTDGANSYRYTASDGSWSLLLTTDDALDICGFTDRFVSRFQFFQNIESRMNPGGAPAFPAVLELQ